CGKPAKAWRRGEVAPSSEFIGLGSVARLDCRFNCVDRPLRLLTGERPSPSPWKVTRLGDCGPDSSRGVELDVIPWAMAPNGSVGTCGLWALPGNPGCCGAGLLGRAGVGREGLW